MSSISSELSKLAEELNRIEPEIHTLKARFSEAKAHVDFAQASCKSAEQELAGAANQKAVLLKKIAGLVETETANLPQGANVEVDALLSRPVNELELSTRIKNVFKVECVYYIGELVQLTETELRMYQNLGRRSSNDIKKALALCGLTLGMKIADWQRPVESP